MITHKDTTPRVQIVGALPWAPEGSVFEARLDNGAAVVVAKLGDDPDVLARARCALALHHPAIARNHAIVDLEDGPALVQAASTGPALSALDDVSRFRLQSAALSLVDQLLAALEHAHELGVTHGDLRSDDVVVVDGTRVMVRRFGFARPSRPPSPRYDLLALGECLAPFIADEELRSLVVKPPSDAGTLRRMLRETTAARSASGELEATAAGGPGSLSEDPYARTTASPSSSSLPSSSSPSSPARGSKREAARLTAEGLVGRTLGDFVVRQKLAEGGLGMVFRAEQPTLGRQAVIKIPFSKHGVSDRLLLRFTHEAQLASRLDHPYAAHVYAFGHEPDGLMWIAMELVAGTSLDEYLRVCGPMPAARAAAFVGRLAEVMHRAHELGIVHRDIKPSNVMVVQRSGRLLPKLLDFGIARDVSALRASIPAMSGLSKTISDGATTAPPGSLTLAGSIMGSPLYMAPEQWDDATQAGPTADIYSLGVLTYEVLTGRTPFSGTTLGEVERAHKTAAMPPLEGRAPRAVEEALRRALAKRASERFATTLDFAAALDAAVGGGEAASLPQVAASLRAEMIERAPPPIAETLAALDGARNAHQARSALDQLVDVTANWIGVIALAARSKSGAAAGGDSARARAIVRELGQRVLVPGEWLELARELTRPWAARPELHPLAELVAFLSRTSSALDELLARRQDRGDLSESRVCQDLGEDVRDVERLLEALSFLTHVRVVVMRRDGPEVWAGVRRGARPAIALRLDGLSQGDVILVDADAVPLARLHPLVQALRPMPGGAEELFLTVGGGAAGGRLVAPPNGFLHDAPEVLAWLRQELLAGDADDRAGDAGAERAPYRGLQPFTADDADNFIGREREREAFVNRLRVQSLLAVVGRSGSGKSSFVQAGVIPHLPRGWRGVTMRPGATPMATLQARLGAGGGDGTTLVVVDQFEELFTLCHDADERQRFARALADCAARPDIRVVITLRDDFLIAAEELTPLREQLAPGLVLLGAPGRDDLERILVEPARRRGYAFDDAELPRRIVAEVADQPGALPMLSFAAATLWERRDRHFKKLLVRAYDAMGGVTGALVGHAEAMLDAMTAGERALVRDIFRRLVTAEGTRAVVGKRALVETLGDRARGASAVEKLIASRLVVASEGEAGGDDEVEVAHEMLLSAWPRLVQWRREDQEGARLRQQLADASRQWSERGRPSGLLWRDDALAEYRLWQKRHGGGLTAVEKSFADASVAADDRARRRRRAGVAVGFALMAAVSMVLWTLNRRAERATAETRARLVDSYLAQARTKLVGGRRWEALASIVAAQKMGAAGAPIDLMRSLARAPARALEFRIRANTSRTWSVDYSADGKELVTTGEDGAALWDAATGALRARLQGHDGSVRDGAFSPDGRLVATIGFDGTVRLWNAGDGASVRVLRGHGDGVIVRCIGWRGDGARLATGADDGGLRVWDPTTGAVELAFQSAGKVSTCAWGGARFGVGDWDGNVVVVEDGRVVKIGRHEGLVRSVRFSRDGTLLASASGDKTVRVWDVAARRLVSELRGAGDMLISADFSPDGRRVVAASRDGTARVWDAASGRLEATLAGHQGAVWYAEFDHSGKRIVTSADDGSARVWDAATAAPLAVLEGHDKALLRARFSPDDAHVVTSSYDGTVAVWRNQPSYLVTALPTTAKLQALPPVDITDALVYSRPDATTVWRPETPGQLSSLPGSITSAVSRTRAVTVDASGRVAHVYRLPSGEAERALEMPAPIVALAVDEARLALAARGGDVQFFDRDGATSARLHGAGDLDAISFIDATPANGRWLTISIADAMLRIRRGDRIEAELALPPRSVWTSSPQLLYSPARDRVAILGTRDLLLLSLGAAPSLQHFVGHQSAVIGAHFDAAGERLVTTSEDGTGAVWDVAGGRLLHRLSPKSQYLADALFDGSGRVVITDDGHGDLEFFDAESAQLLGNLEGTGRPATRLRLDGGRVVEIGLFGDLQLWNLPSDGDSLATAERDLACKAPPAVQVGRCAQ